MSNVRKKKQSSVRVKPANSTGNADRPFNRLLQERDDREQDRPRRLASLKPANAPEKSRKTAKSSTQQIMELLKEFNTRLKRDEQERERLWKEMDTLQETVKRERSRGVVPAESMEKWKRVMEDNQRALYSQIEKTQSMQDEMDKRIESVETTSGSVAIRFDDVLSQQKRLSHRLDTALEDKTRMLKKMANLEDALVQTQETLKAKSLTLLSEQVSAPKPSLPNRMEDPLFVQTKATERVEDTYRNPAAMKPRHEAPSRLGYYATAASVLVVLVGAGMWFTQKNNSAPTMQEFVSTTPSSSIMDSVDMAAIAPQMNAIEPGGLTAGTNDTAQLETLTDLNAQNVTEPVAEEVPVAVKTSLQDEILQQEQSAVERLIRNVRRGDLRQIIGVDSSLPPAVKEVETEALADNGAAQHDLAAIYTAGHGGISVNFDKAAEWFEQASYNGVANARYNLGVLYHQGLGVSKDEAYAVDLYRTAAHINHPEAQYNLGIAYIEGVGVSQDIARAAHYFEEAATNDVMEAAYNLGLIHENGLLGQKQPDEALFWYKVASSKGSLEGRQALESLSSQLELSPSDVDSLISRIVVLKPDVKMALGVKPTTEAPVEIEPVSTEIVYTEKPKKSMIESFSPGSDTVIVAQIQEQLIGLGLYPGPADGLPGPVTSDAVRAYQKTNGLQMDGQATEDLLVHMLAREFELNTYPGSGLFQDVGSQE